MAKTDSKKRWIDGMGNPVPPRYVPPVDKRRDKLVTRLVEKAQKTSKQLEALRQETLDAIEAYLTSVQKDYKINERTVEGNKRLSDFSHSVRLELKKGKYIDFDERLNVAKGLIDDCIEKWSEGSDDRIKALVDQAFQVNERGRLNKDRILGLQKLKFKDPTWTKAMKLINDSIQVVGSRDYVTFHVRNKKGDWESIPLDIARF